MTWFKGEQKAQMEEGLKEKLIGQEVLTPEDLFHYLIDCFQERRNGLAKLNEKTSEYRKYSRVDICWTVLENVLDIENEFGFESKW